MRDPRRSAFRDAVEDPIESLDANAPHRRGAHRLTPAAHEADGAGSSAVARGVQVDEGKAAADVAG
jgi:hypothetical protein